MIEQPPTPIPTTTPAHTDSVPTSSPAILPLAATYFQQLQAQALQVQQLQEKLLRLAAEIDNLKKRTAREKEEVRRFANESFAEDLIAVLDSFQLGINAASTATDPQSIAQGFQLAMQQLMSTLQKHGISPIDCEGAPFDPHLHEAIASEPAPPGTPDNTVLRQLRRGWKYHERLLRPASVIVAVEPSQPQTATPQATTSSA